MSEERLDVHIDGVTYSIKRRRFNSGNVGFKFQAGAVVHGRKVWIQVLVIDRKELTLEEQMRKRDANRRKKLTKRARRGVRAEQARAEAEAWRRRGSA